VDEVLTDGAVVVTATCVVVDAGAVVVAAAVVVVASSSPQAPRTSITKRIGTKRLTVSPFVGGRTVSTPE
jgi:hypothetical protein